jgi:hypothetical protein
MRTSALIGLDGSIDWCCFPRFDSASLFAALLDARKGGRFRIAPTTDFTSEQRYLPATNVLVTTFHTDLGGVVELTDFMPFQERGRELSSYHEIHRRLQCTRGQVEVEILDDAHHAARLGGAPVRGHRHRQRAVEGSHRSGHAGSALGACRCGPDRHRSRPARVLAVRTASKDSVVLAVFTVTLRLVQRASEGRSSDSRVRSSARATGRIAGLLDLLTGG